MASPDRTIFEKKKNDRGRTIFKSYPYSHVNQVTVRSSYYAQRYFNAEPFRDAFLFRHTRSLPILDGKLYFTAAFARADAAIQQFNAVPFEGRKAHFKGGMSAVPEKQVKAMLHSMTSGRRQGKPSLVDYSSFKELDSLIAAQNSINTINGLPNSKDKVSIDRTFIGDTVRYDWNVQVMGWHDNDAKVAGRFIFENQEALDYCVETHSELEGKNNHQVVAHELRKPYEALLNTYYSRITAAGGDVADDEPAQEEDYEVEGDDDIMAGIDEEVGDEE